MKSYAVYDLSGEIIRYGYCQDNDLMIQDTLVVEGVATSDTHYVFNGVLTPYTQRQAAIKSARPVFFSTWSNTTFSWSDTRTLTQVQADQLSLLLSMYANAIIQPVTYTSKSGITQVYQADSSSVDNVTRMQLAYAGTNATPQGFYWIALDNTKVPFTYADIQGLAASMGSQGFTAFANLQTKKSSVLAATTIANVLAVTWT